MIRSLRTGITGLRSNQLRLDVIGNNISGVNTVGFKRSRVLFQDALTQRIATGGQLHGPNATNPSYVGHGVAVGAVDAVDAVGSCAPRSEALAAAVLCCQQIWLELTA